MGADPDEARARATLADMQARLARGPHDTLGVSQGAEFDVIRSAFLELTKVYHPAKFGRMSSELQRLSNEIFLGIKSAHDQLVKALGPSPRANRSSQMPPFPVSGSGPNQAVAPEAARATAQANANPAAKTTQPTPVAPRPMHPTQPTGPIPTVRPGSPPPATARPPATPSTNPWKPTPNPASRVPTPPTGVPTIQKTQPLPVVPPQQPQRPTNSSQPIPRPTTPTNTAAKPTAATPAPAFDERAEFAKVQELAKAGKWGDAANAMQTLAAKSQSKQHRALLAYMRGKAASGAGLLDDAMHEFKRALEIDPGLGAAKSALAELQRRAK